ncbi:MAG: hypothetical protein HY859_18275 [Caulobacterales bacterium]|nr:hypothetical protein [Caulobacterales bacterium]
MKKFLIAAVAVATLAGAGAASAQPYGDPSAPRGGYDAPRGDYGDRDGRGGYDDRDGRGGRGYGDSINAKQAELAQRIWRGERSGRLNWREARALRYDLAQIDAMEHQFRRTYGLDRRERAILHARLDRLEYRIVAEMRDGRRYGEGYGGGSRPH